MYIDTVSYDAAPDQLKHVINWAQKSVLNKLWEKNIDCWLAGGSVRSYLVGDKVNDFDLFFRTSDGVSAANRYFLDNGGKKLYENDRVTKWLWNKKKIDVVSLLHDGPEECIKDFDFTICCFAVSSEGLHSHRTGFIDLAQRKLVFNNTKYPQSTLRRLQKYIKRGYTACNGTLEQIMVSISSLDPENLGLPNSMYVD